MIIKLPCGEQILVQKRQKFGGLYDAINGGEERWSCFASDGGGFGQVICDTIQQAIYYFTHQPWAKRAQGLRLRLEPYISKGSRRSQDCEHYHLLRDGETWSLICNWRQS